MPFGGGPYFVTVLPGPASAAAAKLSPASTANCTSGGTRVITVYTYDAFGNPSTTAGDSLTVSVTGTDPVSGQMVASALGQYMFNYTCVTASNQKSLLTVTVTSHSISTPIVSNLPLTTLPGPVSPANIQVSPPGILTAGAPFPVSFTALDANGNQLLTGGLSLTLQAAMGALSPVILPVADRGDGTYQATLVLTAAGTYQLSANVSGQQFYPGANASQTVIVQPATPAAALTAVALPTNFTAGAPSSFTVQLRDQFSNPVPTGLVSAANLQLYSVSSQTGASSPLVPSITQDPSTGIYTVAFTPLAAGLLRVALTVNGVLALNSSTGQLFSAPVLPGALSPGNCHVTGAGFLVGAASGVPASFLISANDAFNNSVAALPPGTTFDVTFSDQTLSLSAPISLQASGVYVASYTPTLAQVTANPTLTITVGFNGTNIATSAVKVWAQPGPVSVANSRVIDASGIPVGSAVKGAVGTPLQLFIQPRDAAGLDIRSAGAANLFSATVPSLGNVVPVALSDGTGRYALSFTPPRAGLIAVQITSYTDSTRALANSPMMAQIAPGPTAAATAQLLQAGGSQPFSTSTPRVAGVEDIIVVRSYDAQGNVQVYSALAGGDVYAAALTGPANVSASLTDNQDGTYALRYTATLSGTYNLTVSLRQGSALVPVANQPLQITMINSAFSIAQSSARPAPALTTTAASGVPFVFTIVARYGRPLLHI